MKTWTLDDADHRQRYGPTAVGESWKERGVLRQKSLCAEPIIELEEVHLRIPTYTDIVVGKGELLTFFAVITAGTIKAGVAVEAGHLVFVVNIPLIRTITEMIQIQNASTKGAYRKE